MLTGISSLAGLVIYLLPYLAVQDQGSSDVYPNLPSTR